VPGSHRWTRPLDAMKHGPLPITAIDFKDMNAIGEILTAEEIKAWKPVNGNLEKGQVSFHHPMTTHGSNPNKSDSWRRAAVLNYFADGTLSHSNDEILHGFTPKGTPMGGKFHPLVFDAKMVE
jgi:ectoine hydroxylase-related dioxygenase (phytanoyl-CoA dioxygenase family)